MTPAAPPVLGADDLLGNAGPLPPLRLDGTAYPVATPSVRTLALIEQRLMDSAYEEVDAALERATTDAARKRLALSVAPLDARFLERKEHKVGQPAWDAAFETTRGLTLIVWACIAERTPAFTEADAERSMVADPKAWARAVARCVGPFARALAARLGAGADAMKGMEAMLAAGMPAVAAAVAELEATPLPSATPTP